MSRQTSAQLLKGLKILDLTRLLPGPLATMFLADMGAEVIKVESPKSYDYARDYPPMLKKESAAFLAFNRNKKSLALDYTCPEGKEIFINLVQQTDILFEQFRPQFMAKMGLGYETLKEINPRLIYVAITGYGQTGPYASLAGHDLNFISYAGVLSTTGQAQEAPTVLGIQAADIAGGSYMAMAGALAALFHRSITNKGQMVDVSMMDGAMPLAINPFMLHYLAQLPQQRGEHFLSGGLVNYGVYPCADGKYVALGTLEVKFWAKFCDIIQKPDWKNRCFPAPTEQLLVWKEELTAVFKQHPQAFWVEIGLKQDLLISPVLEIQELANDPQVQARQMIVEQEHPTLGKIKVMGNPLKFSETPTQIDWVAPQLGQDTAAILSEMGFSADKIAHLAQNDIIKVL